ncbi:NAD-dependent protein deacylase [Peribacillus saganii]|uniref:protein acetyllysine N-acetyltransferase n=1 Tax=Peribacillus saganii TaxID=2303992 RepID=A0A372LUQ7_9BACI|nr:NAD-dependent protein deacylase [Peribacillus saganii]RFU71552.1 NAD-dependent protein deacylase [Peribacillus saganii]
MKNPKTNELTERIKHAKNIAILTGAGVSTESGLPDFRSSEGIYKREHRLEYYLSRSYFQQHPAEFWNHYIDIFQLQTLNQYKPNVSHHVLSEIEKIGKNVTIITQNVDGFHQAAGSTNVIEVHGSLRGATCPECVQSYEIDYKGLEKAPLCVKCQSTGSGGHVILEPNIVLYGDAVIGWEQAEDAIEKADLFIAMGSSLSVSPVNMLPAFAAEADIPSVLINNEPTIMDRYFDLVLLGPLGEILKEAASEIELNI